MKKTYISIGIPAFNEEKNILSIISDIRNQNESNFKIEKIIVVSDGSTDKTVSLIREKYKDVKVVNHKDQKGKAARLNEIFRLNTSELLFLLDADIKFSNKNVLFEMVKTYQENKNIGLIFSYHKALPNGSLVGKFSYFGFKVWDRARKSLGSKGIRYYCEGGLLALSKDLSDKTWFPEKGHIGDDSYLFYSTVDKKFKIAVCKKSIVYMQLPNSYKDYVRQMKRFLSDPKMLKVNYKKELLQKYELLNTSEKIKAFAKETLNSPLIAIGYIAFQFSTKLQMFFYKSEAGWKPIER